MKILKYSWDNEIWLIHVEINNNNKADAIVKHFRITDSPENRDAEEVCMKPGESRRIMLSRKGIKETGVGISFGEGIEVTVFKLLDRAYLPTSEDICKLETL